MSSKTNSDLAFADFCYFRAKVGGCACSWRDPSEAWSSCFLTVQPWVSHFVTLSLNVLLCKMPQVRAWKYQHLRMGSRNGAVFIIMSDNSPWWQHKRGSPDPKSQTLFHKRVNKAQRCKGQYLTS